MHGTSGLSERTRYTPSVGSGVPNLFGVSPHPSSRRPQPVRSSPRPGILRQAVSLFDRRTQTRDMGGQERRGQRCWRTIYSSCSRADGWQASPHSPFALDFARGVFVRVRSHSSGRAGECHTSSTHPVTHTDERPRRGRLVARSAPAWQIG
jgi:hypothetical protein